MPTRAAGYDCPGDESPAGPARTESTLAGPEGLVIVRSCSVSNST